MLILIVMCLGILCGNRFISSKYKKINERLQVLCTVLLIFSMGTSLGRRENFLSQLLDLGVQSLLFCLIPTVFSILLVYFLTKRLLKGTSSSTASFSETEELS